MILPRRHTDQSLEPVPKKRLKTPVIQKTDTNFCLSEVLKSPPSRPFKTLAALLPGPPRVGFCCEHRMKSDPARHAGHIREKGHHTGCLL